MDNIILSTNARHFEELFQLRYISVILDDHCSLKTDLSCLINEASKVNKSTLAGFVFSVDTFMPYLSIYDNLFVGSSIQKKEKNNLLTDYLSIVGLTKTILHKSESQLTLFERVKLRLVQLLLVDKDYLIIDNVFQELSIKQRQELLPLLQHIARDKNKAILVLTSDSQIAHSSYIDKIVKIA